MEDFVLLASSAAAYDFEDAASAAVRLKVGPLGKLGARWTPMHSLAALAGGVDSSFEATGVSPIAGALAVKPLVEAGFEIDATTNDLLLTPLHVACGSGAVSVAAALIEHGASLSARTIHGHTALHIASAGGYLLVVELLLCELRKSKANALVNEVDEEGNTPLQVAQAAGNRQVENALHRFMLRFVSGPAAVDELTTLKDWLTNTVCLPVYFNGFVTMGYTRLDVWAEIGLRDDDYALIGVAAPAHRRQIDFFLKKLSTVGDGKVQDSEAASSDSNESDSEADSESGSGSDSD
mmetsp:Transcript_22527/g.42184  ORF Transcript_22527/g.42184 Transcript_22527/m.42184 type:complete len:294 (-) Transcript_22527:514-1395(-)